MMQREHIANILRAEANGVDLAQDDSIMAIVICAQQQDGRVYELGHVSAAAVYQDPQGARRAIERIKWGRRG